MWNNIKDLKQRDYSTRFTNYTKYYTGLKQARKTWYSKLASPATYNFCKSASEPTRYVKTCGNEFLVAFLYVDDMIYTRSSVEMMKSSKE